METINTSKLSQLSIEDKKVYQDFFTILIQMGRDTKLLVKHNSVLTLSEFPHLILLTKTKKYVVIYYSVEQNSWIIKRTPTEKIKFNPTAITGIIDFLSEFDNINVISAIEQTSNYIKTLINIYVKREST